MANWEEGEDEELLAPRQSHPALFRNGECHTEVDAVVKREDLNAGTL